MFRDPSHQRQRLHRRRHHQLLPRRQIQAGLDRDLSQPVEFCFEILRRRRSFGNRSCAHAFHCQARRCAMATRGIPCKSADEFHPIPTREQLRQRLPLPVPNLHHQPSSRNQHLPSLRNQPPINLQPRRPRKERFARLILSHLRLQHLAFRHIRRIRHHHLKPLAPHSTQQIRLDEPHSSSDPMPLRILLRNIQRRSRNIHRRHLRPRQRMRQRHSNCPRPRPHIANPHRRIPPQPAPSTASTKCSVSGRGISTSGVTRSVSP